MTDCRERSPGTVAEPTHQVQVVFRRLCQKVGAGRGLTQAALTDCWRLAELELMPDPDPRELQSCRRRLGLDGEE